MSFVLHVFAAFVILGTLLPFIRSDIWWIRGWDFPRMQLIAIGAAVVATAAATGAFGWPVFAALGVSLLIQVAEIRPYSRLARRQVLDARGGPELALMVSNVLMSNREAASLIALIRECQPDLFVALETDRWWVERLRELEESYPHAVEVPQEDTYGMVLRSRLPLIEPSVEYLVRETIPSIHARVALADGTEVRLHAVHPKPPFPDEDTRSTERDGELLIVGRRVEENPAPTVVFGDLNDVAWSRTTKLFQKVSRLLDPRIGRGRFSTFHAGHWWMRWPLDHVFFSDHFRLRRLERLPRIGSDHFPIFACLSFEPEKKSEQDPPENQPEDRREAREKIEEAREVAESRER